MIEEVQDTASEQTTISSRPVTEIFSGVRGIAVKILNRVERTDAYLDKMLDHEIKQGDFDSSDKALLYELVHGVVRWQGRLDWILAGFYKGQFSKAIPLMKNALRVALYQIMFLDRIPDYAIVNEAVEFVKKLAGQKPADISNAVLRNIIRNKQNLRYPDPNENEIGYLAAYYSHPAWMVKRWLDRFGREETEQLLASNNEKPGITLRVNTLKITVEEFKKELDKQEINFIQSSYMPNYFKLTNLSNITQLKLFTEGYCTIQDESTGVAVQSLKPEPGMRVLDMCAAPGGKSAYIAELMENKGEVVALDVFSTRVAQMQESFDRLGTSIVNSKSMDALEYNDGLFDRVLVDAPCTGMGTLAKKPDIKWKKEILDIRKMTETQNRLLDKAAEMVKPGGIIVYSTCTTEPEENIQVVNHFLKQHPNFVLEVNLTEFEQQFANPEGGLQTFPHRHGMDGAFSARLIRIN